MAPAMALTPEKERLTVAQDLRAKKTAFLVALADFCERALQTRNDCEEFEKYYTDCEFQVGGANEITQADIDASTANHLTPAIVDNAVAAVRAVSTLSAANRDALRTAALKPLVRSSLPGR